MKYYSIHDLVGVEVDDKYPWSNNLCVSKGISKTGKESYDNCNKKIKITFVEHLRVDDVRYIGDKSYINSTTYVDMEYGARIQKKEYGFDLETAQECNEWLIILLQILLVNQGYTLIHGAGIEKNGKALILPSWGGVGKTATVCHFIRKENWRLLGDDLTIVGHNSVLPFLKPFVIYPYHKDLFPEQFSNGKNRTIKNMKINSYLSHVIPFVKGILRPFPKILAYLRRHNPQSISVSPFEIFAEVQLSKGGTPSKFIWLERTISDQPKDYILTAEEITSKIVTVTSLELFSKKLNDIYKMCGCGLLNYNDTIHQMYNIVYGTVKELQCKEIEIPTTVNINNVGEIIGSFIDDFC